MNRKQKIIVSVTGIFLVLLIIVGLTYAYFLTQIVGNTNNKSISIETANLELVYGDGTTELLTSITKLVPSSNPINTKNFTVTNNGDDTHYAVIIENVRAKVAGTDTLTTFDSNDFKYTLTCTKEDGTSCNGVSEQTVLPMSDNILVENDIVSGDTHTYVITVWYLDNGNDQSSDMNKTLEARINIEDPNRINPYTSKPNSLAYNIINNSLNVSESNISNGYAVYRSTSLTTPIKESLSIEWSVSQAPDDYTETSGINSFYYRGNVENNYLEFNDMCWRIVRIEGDGSVKLTLAKQDLCSTITDDDTLTAFIAYGDYGYTNDIFADYENSANRTTSMKYKFNAFLNGGSFIVKNYVTMTEETLTFTPWGSDKLSKLKSTTICLGDVINKYDMSDGTHLTDDEALSYGYWNYQSISFNSLKCDLNGKSEDSYQIYPLTVGEIFFAGISSYDKNYSSYLYKNAQDWWLTSTIAWYYNGMDIPFYVDNMSGINGDDSTGVNTGYFQIRPAISLIPGIELASDSGDGTKNNPYRVIES